MTDYYEVLGVDEHVSQDDLKKAYRDLAKQYHPDKNPNNEKIESRFKDITAAYDTLGDEAKRSEYDFRRHATQRQDTHGMDLNDILNHFRHRGGARFRGFGDSNPSGGSDTPESPSPDDAVFSFQISLVELKKGIAKQMFRVMSHDKCKACDGVGGKEKKNCKNCENGEIIEVKQMGGAMYHSSKMCPICVGRGKIINDPCIDCQTRGFIEKPEFYEVSVSCKKVKNQNSKR